MFCSLTVVAAGAFGSFGWPVMSGLQAGMAGWMDQRTGVAARRRLPGAGGGLGRAGEALGDGHPGGGRRTGDGKAGVGDVAHLRDDLREFERAALDAIAGLRLVPVPNLAAGTGEAHMRRGAGRLEAAVDERPAVGAHPDGANVLQARLRLAIESQDVIDLLAVRPGFHLPRRGKHAHAHVGASPGQSRVGLEFRKPGAEILDAGLPDAEQGLAAAKMPEALARFVARGEAFGLARLHLGPERPVLLSASERGERHQLAEMQVPQHVVDGPRLEGRLALEVGIRKAAPGQRAGRPLRP